MANQRLELAQKLRELADRSSEAELRMALSRSYYSVFHLAKILSRRVTHETIEMEIAKVEPGLTEIVAGVRNAVSS